MVKSEKIKVAGKAAGKGKTGSWSTKTSGKRGKTVGSGASSQASKPADREDGFLVAARFCVDDLIDVDTVSKELNLTKAMLAQVIGLSEETLQRFSRASAPKTQTRLRDLLDILTRATPFAGGVLQAFGWYRGQGIPALGDETAEALVKTGRAEMVRAYLDAYAAGAYA